jgi:putative MATE family efflux protein
MTKSMVEGNTLKLILSFSVPLLLGNLFQQFYNVVDAAIVGQTLGSTALAAVGASSSVQFLIIGFCMGICQGFAIMVSQSFGANRLDEMKKYIFNGAIWTAIFAIVISVIVVILCGNILHILSVNDEIFSDAYAYLVVIFAGIPFTLLYNYLSAILRAVGDSKTPFMFLAFSAILNIGLDFFCILVLGWGCAGAAIATIFSQAVSGILCLLLIGLKVPLLHVPKQARHFDLQHSFKLLGMGIPMGLQFSITAIGSMVMQSANNALGTIYVSGFTAGMRIKSLMMCPFDALGSAVSTFLSQNYGAQKLDRIYDGFRKGIVVGVLYGVFACLVMVFFGRVLSMMFVSADEVDVLNASALYLRRMGYFYPVLGILITARMSIQGLGYSTRAMLGGFVEMIARCVVALCFVPIFKFDAITWADQSAWTTATLILIPLWLLTINQIKKTINQ